MSIGGISAAGTYSPSNYDIAPQRARFGADIQQLGQDIQSGNLSAAQQDFATLQQDGPSGSSSSSTSTTSASTNNPVSQAFNQLSDDLQSGNLAGALRAYSNIQQDFPNASQTEGHSSNHLSDTGPSQANSLFLQLGQELENGTLSSAQQGYSSLTPDVSFGQVSSTQIAGSNGVSLSI